MAIKASLSGTQGKEWRRSDCNSLDLIERNLILPSVVELGRPRALAICDVLRGFKHAVVLLTARASIRRLANRRFGSDHNLDLRFSSSWRLLLSVSRTGLLCVKRTFHQMLGSPSSAIFQPDI